jgi:hypothetical protein
MNPITNLRTHTHSLFLSHTHTRKHAVYSKVCQRQLDDNNTISLFISFLSFILDGLTQGGP